jgi:hypothetical protein
MDPGYPQFSRHLSVGRTTVYVHLNVETRTRIEAERTFVNAEERS